MNNTQFTRIMSYNRKRRIARRLRAKGYSESVIKEQVWSRD